MEKRKLRDLEVSAIGLGCMGFSTGYGAIPSEEESIRLIHKAHDLGCTIFDTAEVYATYRNEELVGKAIKPIRNEIILCSKYSPRPLPGQDTIEGGKLSFNGVAVALESSLNRLQTDHLDLYYVHRMPENFDLEELASWFGRLIKEGKIRSWGVSEATAEQIKVMNAVTPITAVQSEYSMMARQWEDNVLSLCKELGIGFVAYAPLAGGFLSGKYNANTEFKGDDIRTQITRYKKENVEKNQPLLDLVNKYATEKEATPAQISLAWVMHGYDSIVPIPGMRKDSRIIENLGAADITLSDEEYNKITEELDKIKIYGERKDEDIAKLGKLRTEMYGEAGVAWTGDK